MEEAASGCKTEGKNNTKPKQNRNTNTNKGHILRKRRPQKPERGDSIIYVSTKTPTKALLERCNKLINKGETELVIYCLGAAIQRGILLALKVCEQHVAFNVHPNTFTTELLDDLEPATDDADYSIQRRFNSALKIRVFRKDLLETKP